MYPEPIRFSDGAGFPVPSKVIFIAILPCVGWSVRSCGAQSVDEWIVGVAVQRGLAGHVGAAGDAWDDGAGCIAPVARRERAADDALLHPRFARRELSGCCKARDLGAGAGPTGRAIVGASRAEHEV